MPASSALTRHTEQVGAPGPAVRLLAPLAGWLAPLEELPDPVFAGRTLGDGLALDPTGDTLHAPCAGVVSAVAATGHAVTLKVADGAEVLMHLGIDTVAMGGAGFEPLVKEGQSVAEGAPLIRFDLDAVVCQAASAMTPVLLLESDSWQLRALREPGPVALGDPILEITPRREDAATIETQIAPDAPEIARTLTVPLRHGIHARPAARLRKTAAPFDAMVRMEFASRTASLGSPVGMLALGVRLWDEVTLYARGPEAEAALDALEELIESGMGEKAAPGEQPPARAVVEPAPAVEKAQAIPEDGVLHGVCAAAGLAVGQAVHYRLADIPLAPSSGDPAREQAALRNALDGLAQTIARESAQADAQALSILTAHAAMLEDEDLRAAAEEAIATGMSAGEGWKAAIEPQVQVLLRSGDARLAERADDMRDLERRVLCVLAGVAERPMDLEAGTVLLAEDLLPSQFLALDTAKLAGIVLQKGGPTSHVAILAGGKGVPMVVAMGPVAGRIEEGATLILEAGPARLETRPSPERIADVRGRLERLAARREEARGSRAPAATRDGTRIEVFANTGSVEDAELAVANGAEGCGLLRSEFLFLERPAAPDIAEQAAAYQAIADVLEPRPLIVRLLDIGGDKPASYLPITGEENPALGLRGIRVGLAHPDILEAQIEAIARVAPQGRCKIMVPMVASLAEVQAVRRVLESVTQRLGITERIELGIMVETPAAAATADILAREADFLSIGTNDLTQYTLAMDRMNAHVAASLDGLHPAVLRLVAQTCAGAARHGRWTGVCGSLASDPVAVPLLLGLGVTELSASAAIVTDIKALVARLDLAACRALAERALECASAGEVRALVAAFEQEEMEP